MKKLLTLLILTTAGLTVLPMGAQAEDQKPPPGEGARPGPGRARMDPAERLKMMTEKLGLTQEQQDKIKAIFEKNAPQFKELMAKGRENLSEDDKTKLRELGKSQSEEVAAILTPEQKEKMKEMRPPGGRPGGPRDGDHKKGPGDGPGKPEEAK